MNSSVINPRFLLARRRAGLHIGYVRAVEAKPVLTPEIYAYPAIVRREASDAGRTLSVPDTPRTSTIISSSCGWSRIVGAIVIMVLWFVGANVTPGA